MTTLTDRIVGLNGFVGIKPPVKAATTANITLSGEQTIDGVAVVATDRVLVKDQTDGTENGIWVVSASAWSRAPDFNGARDAISGTLVVVNQGTANGGAGFRLSTADDITIGTTSLTFTSTFIESGSPGLLNVVEDLTPQLGGHLDLNGWTIQDPSGDVELLPAGGSSVLLTSTSVILEQDLKFATQTGTKIRFGLGSITFTTGAGAGTERAKLDANGLTLGGAAASVNEFSTDGTLAGNSDDAVPTEKAVKTYVDSVKTTAGTALTPVSGTSSEFTSLPSGIDTIEIALHLISTTGTSGLRLEVGHGAGTWQVTQYVSGASNDTSQVNDTTAFAIVQATAATNTASGVLTLSRVSGNIWALSGNIYTATGSALYFCAGSVIMDGELDAVRLTTVGGTDTFDGGSWNIKYR